MITLTLQERQHTSTISRLGAAAALSLGIFTMLRCGAANVRPFFNPMPEARADTVMGTPDAVIRGLQDAVQAAGVQLSQSSEAEGYLESKWYDTADGTSMNNPGMNTHTRVRLRFWVDPFRERQSVVISEVVRRRAIDPSIPERELEILVEPSHPGDSLAVRILAALRTRLNSGPTN